MVAAICGRALLVPTPLKQDRVEATDLIVLNAERCRIAVRLRTSTYFDRYPNDLTIRSRRPNGSETELVKILSGWGDYFFYGFADYDQAKIIAYRIIDLRAFRNWHATKSLSGTIPGERRTNADGSSEFTVFDFRELPREAIIKAFDNRAVMKDAA